MRRSLETIVVFLLFFLLTMISSCERQSVSTSVAPDYSSVSMDVIREDNVFSSHSIQFPNCDQISDVQLVNNTYYVVTCCGLYGETDEPRVEIYRLTGDSSEMVSSIDVDPALAVVKVIDDNRIAVLSNDSLRIYDIQNGTAVVSRIDPYELNDMKATVISERLVLAGSGRIQTFDFDGNNVDTITDDLFREIDSIFEYHGDCFFSRANGVNVDFYRVNMNEHSWELMIASSELGINGYSLYGNSNYSVDPGTYEVRMIDLSEKKLIYCSHGENMLVKPLMSGNDTDNTLLVLDPEHYVSVRNYINITKEVVIIEPDKTLDLESREKLVIGGTDFVNCRSIYIAAYNFNMAQDDYLVVLDDYGKLSIDADEPSEYQAKLIQYLQSGNAPDIYFGPLFDYGYFYRNNMVINMYPLMAEDDSFDIDSIQPCIRDILISEDKVCYQMMAGYYPVGYLGRSRNFEEGEVSIYDIEEFDPDSLFGGQALTSSLLSNVMRYVIEDMYKETSGEHITEIEDLLNYAVDYGRAQYDSRSVRYEDLANDDVLLMANSTVLKLNDFRILDSQCDDDLVYVGYPGIVGSVHPAMPECLMAISSTSKEPKICWKFITYLLSDELQRFMIYSINARFPVIKGVLDEYLDYMQKPEIIPDDKAEYRSMARFYKQLSQDTLSDDIADYRKMGEAVDAVVTYDYGIDHIINEEVSSIYSTDKTVKDVAGSLDSRLRLYYMENYS